MDTAVNTLDFIITALNKLSPLGLAGGLAYIIWQLVSKKGRIQHIATEQHKISSNHLSGLPEMAASLMRIEKNTADTAQGVAILLDRKD